MALVVSFGPATYTNGTQTQTFPVICEDIIRLPTGGTLTFEVYAFGDITDNLYLYASPLPTGATFPPVGGVLTVHSTFTWTNTQTFFGDIRFYPRLGTPIHCALHFDFPLPVELSSFTSVIYGNNINLNWQTASENNNSRFDIEKKKLVNGIIEDWIPAGSVAGNGTTTSPSNYTFTDRALNEGIYKYRLKQIDYNGNFEYYYLYGEVKIGVPVRFELSQNYPNPFNPSTIIYYNLATGNQVSLKVYNSSGMEVKTLVEEFKNAGYYSLTFDGKNLSSGVYYYKIISGNFVSVKKMTLLK